MLFSKACEYGIRAALYVAAQPTDGYTSVKDISERLGISFTFLAKIAQTLKQAGLLRTIRGPQGGIALARPARDIRLIEVVRAIDGNDLFTECALGLPGCGHRTPCPLHADWAVARARVTAMLEDATLGSVSEDILTLGLRLAEPDRGSRTPEQTPTAPVVAG